MDPFYELLLGEDMSVELLFLFCLTVSQDLLPFSQIELLVLFRYQLEIFNKVPELLNHQISRNLFLIFLYNILQNKIQALLLKKERLTPQKLLNLFPHKKIKIRPTDIFLKMMKGVPLTLKPISQCFFELFEELGLLEFLLAWFWGRFDAFLRVFETFLPWS